MPPRETLLIHRNPTRLFATGRVGIEECRGCLFKALCLENEKNPTIRRLVLGEEIVEQEEQDKDFAAIMRDCGL